MIRYQTKYKAAVIPKVIIAAIEAMEISNHPEQFIIETLRSAGGISLSLVAELFVRVVEHIAFSPVAIDGRFPQGIVTFYEGFKANCQE